jgi:molybdate transport system substrate-binding protein
MKKLLHEKKMPGRIFLHQSLLSVFSRQSSETSMKEAIAWLVVAALYAAPAVAADVNVMSGGAPKEALNVLIPQFERATGHHVKLTYVLISALRQRIADGETPDMVIMPTTAIDGLIKLGRLNPGGYEKFGTVRLVAIARKGAARPDISTPEAFKDALLKARSVVYSTPTATPSGAHMAQLVSRLQIADAIEKKVHYKPALEGGVQMVSDGTAEIGIYPGSEVVHVSGVDQIGPLPESLQLSLVYAGAVTSANTSVEPAQAFIKFLASGENRRVWENAGFQPPS